MRKEKAKEADATLRELCRVVNEYHLSLLGLADRELEKLSMDPSAPPHVVYETLYRALSKDIGLHRYHT